jgi:hypothetical protein
MEVWSASLLNRFTPVGKSPRFQMDRRLSEPKSRFGYFEEEKKIRVFAVAGIEPPAVQIVTRRYID